MEEHDENRKRPRNVYVEADESVVSNEGSDLSPASSTPSMDDAVGNITSALKSLLSEDEDDTRGPEELVDCIADMTCVLVSGTKQQPGQQRSAMTVAVRIWPRRFSVPERGSVTHAPSRLVLTGCF